MRKFSRRAMLAAIGGSLIAQTQPESGSASRGVQATARPKPSGLPWIARFTDVAAKAGLTRPVIFGGADRADYILEATGCGVAFFDYDNDGWLDILVLNGSRLDTSAIPPDTTNRLYKNNRDGTFTDVTEKAGLIRQGWAQGVTIGDYNNDGHEDIFITYYGQNVLYRNNGDGTFTDVTKAAGLLHEGTRWGSGCTFIDYDRDGNLDLFVGNYVDFDVNKVGRPGANRGCTYKTHPVFCGPRGLKTPSQYIYRNNGDGTFRDATAEAFGILEGHNSFAMSAIATDLDNDGWPDIFVACDSTASFYFHNRHNGTFHDDALERGISLAENGQVQAGMGVAVGDYNLDGNLDLFKTHFAEDTNELYRNDGTGNFEVATLHAGLGVETRYVSWGAGIVDLDNDGWPDLFFVTGSPYPGIEKKVPAMQDKGPRVIFRNLGNGKFEEMMEGAGPGIYEHHSSRGCAFGDFDNDGDMDILIMNMNEPPSLLRNDLQKMDKSRHWLKVKLIGVKSNRSAIGGRVTASYGGKKQAQEVHAQSSYFSVNDSRLHFGLGDFDKADLEVRWPNGGVEKFAGVAAGRLITIREGEGIIRGEAFPAA
ncbi:MAG TPA: CRTAC1 family protein [Bryobacteraceae bacterium]|nr:CRTAC1 family protein [Bryobacteraceae bacterium]